MTGRQATPDVLGDVLGKTPGIERVAVKRIKVDGGTQMRAALNPETVGEYADAMKENGWGSFPAVVLYYDGSDYWLADGFHRVAAIKVAKDAWIDDIVVPADVRAGNRRDAVLHAAGANAQHGLRRSNQDKRRAVEVLLRDEEWQKWSDREIARQCNVSNNFVGELRKVICHPMTDNTERTVSRGGQIYTQNVSNIGSNQPQYVSVWELQRRVEEHARQNGWQAPMLRSAARNQRNDGNYLLLEAAITVEYRRSDLVQAIHNVANQWEDREEQQRKAKEWQVVQLPTDIADAGYQIQWKAADGWRVLDADGGHVQSGLSSLSECATLIRRRVTPAGTPLMGVFKTAEEEAYVAEALDIAAREAAADDAERQAMADIATVDPWAAALATPGSRQRRAEALAEALMPWIREYKDAYGRDWSDLALHGNPSHSNSTFWGDIGKECTRRGVKVDEDTLKLAIKQAFSWMLADETESPVTEVTAPAGGKLVVDWLDKEWTAYKQTLPTGSGDVPADEATMAAVLTPDATPVSFRPDYDSDEWYTPAEYIEAARRVMGSIDLDPATCELAQTVVQADVYLTKFENGLVQKWIRENVWLNPPYGQADPWVAKLLAEYDKGAFVQQAIVLLNNMTETGYFQSLLTRFPVCFPNRRIPFWRHDQQGLTGRQGQALFYLGSNVDLFVEEFGAFGPVLRRVE